MVALNSTDPGYELSFSHGGVRSSLSFMLPALKTLLSMAPKHADRHAFQQLVVDEDALHKTSLSNEEVGLLSVICAARSAQRRQMV